MRKHLDLAQERRMDSCVFLGSTSTGITHTLWLFCMGGPIIDPAPTPHGTAEDANQHLPGGAGPPPRDLPTPSVLANSPSSVASPESVGGARTRPWSDGKRATVGLRAKEAIREPYQIFGTVRVGEP